MKKKLKPFGIVIICFLILGIVSCQLVNSATNKAANKAGIDKKHVKAVKSAGEGVLKVMKALEEMNIKDERALGETISLQAYATPKFGAPIRNDKLMRTLNIMVNAIAINSNRPMIPYHVAIVKTDDVNAFSTPGGYIFLTTGLVNILESEAELACVLGHEIAHIAQKHAVKSMSRSKAVSEGAKAITNTAGSLFNNNFGFFESLVKEMGGKLFVHNFDLGVEKESDAYGVGYAYETGYDPTAMIDFLKKLKAREGKGGTLASHPNAQDRIDALNTKLNEFKKEEDYGIGLVKNTGRLAQIKKWISESTDDEWK